MEIWSCDWFLWLAHETDGLIFKRLLFPDYNLILEDNTEVYETITFEEIVIVKIITVSELSISTGKI